MKIKMQYLTIYRVGINMKIHAVPHFVSQYTLLQKTDQNALVTL